MAHPLRSLLATLMIGLAACGGSDDNGTGPDPDDTPPPVASIITGVSVAGVNGVARSGAPASDAGAPTLTVNGASTIIPGGGSQFDLTGSAPFSTLYVFVQGQAGYYEIDLSALPELAADPRRLSAQLLNTTITMTNGTTLPGGAYVFEFAAGRGQGAGTRRSRPVTVQRVGTGGVQVSVSWNSQADVDLYLVEPSGNTIYYGNRSSASGGVLDLDSNAACSPPDLRNENINWPSSSPPAGTYTVRVNYWDSCEAASTDWLVTVRVPGQPVRTFTGRFTGDGVGGSVNAGQVVTSFTVSGSGSLVLGDAPAAPFELLPPFPTTAAKLGR
jgi:hypothetical protein